MDTTEPLDALTVTGDRIIAHILSEEGVVIYPAYSCRYDGFVNDVLTEYTNPSIFRPPSVRQARLQSQLTASFALGCPLEGLQRPVAGSVGARPFSQPAECYVGWTMYDDADSEESLTVWLGARRVAHVRTDDGDNRLHLYVLKKPFFIDNGEQLRLITDATDGQYRIENIVLLPTLPADTSSALAISDVAAELDDSLPSKSVVRLNWRTSRPARCTVSYSAGDGVTREVTEAAPLANHCVALSDAQAKGEAWFEIVATAASGETVATGRNPLAKHLAGGHGETQTGRIAFTVNNRQDEPLAAWPITWGFPFPRSALWGLDHCRIVGSDGQPLPSQKRVQVSWDDGSVRWALCDFQVDLPASGAAEMLLEYGPDIADKPPGDGMRVSANADAVEIDAGVLRMSVSRSDYAFPATVEVRREGTWERAVGHHRGLPAITLVDAAGAMFECQGQVDEIALEEEGPLRAVVRVNTTHRASDGNALFRSVLRLTAYQGQPFLRVQHTFENDRTQDLFTIVRSLSLWASVEPGWLAQLHAGGAPHDMAAAEAVRLRQPLADRFTLTRDGEIVQEGQHAEDWLAVSGPSGTLAVGMRDLWQNYPKGWQVDKGALRIDICPDVADVAYPQGGVQEVRSFFYLQGGQYKLKYGMARTHDMLFAWAPGVAEATSAVCTFSRAPLVRMEPDLLVRTGVVSAYALAGSAGAEEYDAWTAQALELYERNRRETEAYGMLNYGDWYGERRSNWGDMEYDTPYGFLLEYLRGGSDRCFDLGWQAAWHLVDVDTCHYHPDPARAGRQYLHSLGHVGSYYPDGYLPGAISGESMSWTHTWIEGLFLYALLTGERRLWEVAGRTVEILAGADLNDYDFTNCRDCGWPLRHLIGAYQATGRAVFLNGARIIVERVLERQRPTGGWERLMVPGHCFHVPPRHMGNAGFMVGILLAALKRYHEETGDEAVAESIVAAARYLVRDMWEEEHTAFRYTSCPQSSVTRSNTQELEGLGYAWRLSRDEELRHVLIAGWEACLSTPLSAAAPYGKDVSTRLRSMPFILRDVVSATAAPEKP